MESARTLVWLASYPKSGNTWLRAFLANYFFATDGPADFELMSRISSGDVSAPSYAELAGGDPARLALPAYMKVRHRHLERIATGGAALYFVKTHCAPVSFAGLPMIPPRLTRQALYIVRHPLDMLVSYADHWGLALDRAARQIADPRNAIAPNAKTAAQFIGAWSDHVRAWRRVRDFPVLMLRYEDMLDDPEKAFTAVIRHIRAPLDQATLASAIERASFGRLAALEESAGFPERGPSQQRFFRSGTTGGWRETVPPEIVEKVREEHGAVMKRYGYLE